jgi:hypothetical protein
MVRSLASRAFPEAEPGSQSRGEAIRDLASMNLENFRAFRAWARSLSAGKTPARRAFALRPGTQEIEVGVSQQRLQPAARVLRDLSAA